MLRRFFWHLLTMGIMFADDDGGMSGGGGDDGGDGDGGEQGSEAGSRLPGGDEGSEQEGDFIIPDEHKEFAQKKNIKSQEDMWRQMSEQNKVIGKKNAVPDFANATPDEIEEYYARTRPENMEAYEIPEGFTDTDAKAFREAFFKRGIPPHVAKGLIGDLIANGEVREAEMRSEEGFIEGMKTIFGEAYEKPMKEASLFIRRHLNEQDRLFVDKKYKNEELFVMYRFAKDVQRAYGAEEGTGNLAPTGTMGKPTDQEINDALNKVMSMKSGTHTSEEKSKALKEYNDLLNRSR